MYQKDLPPKELGARLDAATEDAVATVGVEVNGASVALLQVPPLMPPRVPCTPTSPPHPRLHATPSCPLPPVAPQRLAGLTKRTATALRAHIDTHGELASRAALRDVPGIGPKTFANIAGFLRITQSRRATFLDLP